MEVDVDTVDTVLCPAWHAMFPSTALTIGDCTCPLCYVDSTVLCPAWHAMFPVNTLLSLLEIVHVHCAMEVDVDTVDTVLCPAWHAMFPVNQHCSHYWRLYMSTVLWK